MGERAEILSRVRQASAQSSRYAAAFHALPCQRRDDLFPLLAAYIKDRFLLPGQVEEGDNILDLADRSLRHILDLKKKGLYDGDTSRACSGASSVIAKKVLLMKAVQEDFGVAMTAEQSAALATVGQLADFILTQKGDHPHDSHPV